MVLSRLSPLLLVLSLIALTPTRSFGRVDIGILFVDPMPSTRLPLNIPSPVTVTIGNQGTDAAQNIGVRVIIRDSTGVVYDDSVTYGPITAGAFQSVSLDDFTATSRGLLTLYVWISLPGDEEPSDNYYEGENWIGYETDAFAVAVVQPQLDAAKLQKTRFEIRGSFKSEWRELNEVPARVQIRRCSDNGLVYQADTVIEHIEGKSKIATQLFPSFKGAYDTRKLEPGCYNISVIARHPTDGDRTNDTASSEFSVVPNKLSNDLMVDTVGAFAGGYIKPDQPLPISFGFINVGKNAQPSAGVRVVVTGPDGPLVYDHSHTFTNWAAGEKRTHNFPAFSANPAGPYVLRVFTTLPTDEFRLDDTLRRYLTVESTHTVKPTKILYTDSGDVVPAAMTFVPRVRFALTGNVVPKTDPMCYFTIHSQDNKVNVSFFSYVRGLTQDSKVVDADFSTWPNGFKASSLRPGVYTATASCQSDGGSETLGPISFRVAYEHDVKIDSLVSPQHGQIYPKAALPILNDVINIGSTAESAVSIQTRIFDRDTQLVYNNITTTSLALLEQKQVALSDFLPVKKGLYDVITRLSLPIENDTTDYNNVYHRFYVGSEFDAAYVAPNNPMPGAVIPAGTLFSPSAILDWFGRDDAQTSTQISVRILKCNSGEEVYYQSNSKPINSLFRKHATVFPSTSIDELGCYEAWFIADHSEDGDRSDDTLIVPFTVSESNSVSIDTEASELGVRQSGANLIVTLVGADLGSLLELYDMTGRLVAGIHAVSERVNIPMQDLPSGTYLMRMQSEAGHIQRRVNYLR